MNATRQILIVDDEQDIREVMQAALEEFGGWLTLTAASGVEGLSIARAAIPDAILLDLSMPEMDGFQLCEELQADSITQKIPVIVLTAKVLESDRDRLADLDVAGIITKPFKPLQVWKQVAEILGWSC